MRLTISCQIGEEQACRFMKICKNKTKFVQLLKEPARTTVPTKTQHTLYMKCLFAEFVCNFFFFSYLTSSIDVKGTGIPEQKAHVVVISTSSVCWIYFTAFEYMFNVNFYVNKVLKVVFVILKSFFFYYSKKYQLILLKTSTYKFSR